MKKEKKIKMSLNDRLAKKILEPYLEKVLHACYDVRELSYALSFDLWARKVNDKLKEYGLSDVYKY